MNEPLSEPDPSLDPDQPIPNDAGELLPEDPGGDPAGVPEPA